MEYGKRFFYRFTALLQMYDSSLGIQIGSTRITAIKTRRTMGGVIILKRIEQDFSQGEDIIDQIRQIAKTDYLQSAYVVLNFPDTGILTRNLSLPGALPYDPSKYIIRFFSELLSPSAPPEDFSWRYITGERREDEQKLVVFIFRKKYLSELFGALDGCSGCCYAGIDAVNLLNTIPLISPWYSGSMLINHGRDYLEVLYQQGEIQKVFCRNDHQDPLLSTDPLETEIEGDYLVTADPGDNDFLNQRYGEFRLLQEIVALPDIQSVSAYAASLYPFTISYLEACDDSGDPCPVIIQKFYRRMAVKFLSLALMIIGCLWMSLFISRKVMPGKGSGTSLEGEILPGETPPVNISRELIHLKSVRQQYNPIIAERETVGKYLVGLAGSIPAGCWITALEVESIQNHAYQFKITGVALSATEIPLLLKNLEKLPFVRNLQLLEISLGKRPDSSPAEKIVRFGVKLDV